MICLKSGTNIYPKINNKNKNDIVRVLKFDKTSKNNDSVDFQNNVNNFKKINKIGEFRYHFGTPSFHTFREKIQNKRYYCSKGIPYNNFTPKNFLKYGKNPLTNKFFDNIQPKRNSRIGQGTNLTNDILRNSPFYDEKSSKSQIKAKVPINLQRIIKLQGNFN